MDDPAGNLQAGPPGMPLWVKVMGLLAGIAVAAFVVAHLMGYGFGGHPS